MANYDIFRRPALTLRPPHATWIFNFSAEPYTRPFGRSFILYIEQDSLSYMSSYDTHCRIFRVNWNRKDGCIHDERYRRLSGTGCGRVAMPKSGIFKQRIRLKATPASGWSRSSTSSNIPTSIPASITRGHSDCWTIASRDHSYLLRAERIS